MKFFDLQMELANPFFKRPLLYKDIHTRVSTTVDLSLSLQLLEFTFAAMHAVISEVILEDV